MESIFVLCMLLFLGGFIIAIVSLLDEEYLVAFFGILFGIIGLFGAALISGEYNEDAWRCCGETITSEYCSECGKQKPVECKKWTCCNHEHDKDIKFCPNCGKARPTDDNTTNNIVVKDNENVEINVNDDGVVVIEDEWTCCDKEISSKFCPDCGKQNNNDATSNAETIIEEKTNNKGE